MNRNSKKRVKVVFKKRFKFNILIIFILILGVSFFTSKSFGKREIHTYNYTVSSNDTLWNISKDVCNKSDENLDIQILIYMLDKFWKYLYINLHSTYLTSVQMCGIILSARK